jgi:hypothetical protein
MQDDSEMDDTDDVLLASIAQLAEVFKTFLMLDRLQFRIFLAVQDPDLSVRGMHPDPCITTYKKQEPRILLLCHFFFSFYHRKCFTCPLNFKANIYFQNYVLVSILGR